MSALDANAVHDDELASLVGDLARLESIFDTWDESPRGAVHAYGRAIEALHGEAIRRLVRALKGEPAALAAMKTAATDEVIYAVLRRHDILKPSLTERVENALASIRPMLAAHGGDVELVQVKPPAIEVRFVGACDGCPASMLTFHAGVKKAVQDACPEITEVRQAKGLGGGASEAVKFVSPFALGATGGWLQACTLAELAQDGVRELVVGGEHVLLAARGNAVTCFQNACAHLGLALHEGEVHDGIITCPHHGFEYDLGTGECLTAPEVQLQSHGVRVVGQRVEVRLSR
jgi:nitrite reductase/ring-hydroxylating ferredoxin subunit/Fe-S cluster biogenesis protein NfuA